MASYLRSIWNCRYFWLSMVRMDLRSRYRGSVLGIGWSLLQPLAMTIIIAKIFGRAFNMDFSEFGPYLLAGLTFWNYWLAVATQGCNCFFQGEAYIRQFPAPMAIYPLRTMLASAFHFGVGLLLAIAMAAWFNWGKVHLGALLTLVPSMVLLLLFGWCVALIFGLATVRFRDTRHLTEVGMQALFYLTPIMYPKPMYEALRGTKLHKVMELNPLTSLLRLVRDPITEGSLSLQSFGIGCATVAVLVLFSALAMTREERRLIFYL